MQRPQASPALPVSPSDAPRRARILLHSHDSYGLGHLRRTLTLAGALAESMPEASVLVTSGSACATQFPMPAGVDVVKLPSATKDERGCVTSRSLRGGIELVVELRRALLREVLRSFRPDLWIVDHQPLGLEGELHGLLPEARERGTRTVLGIRDIIDDPRAVAQHWGRPEVREALASHYDRVCVYGSPAVFDPRVEYPIPPELRGRLEFAGYVVRPTQAQARPSGRRRPHVLVTLGGGEDGDGHALTYVGALARGPVGWDSTLVLGPLMRPERAREIKRLARRIPDLAVRSFHADLPRLLAESDAAVAMAGYNTVAEILQARVPSVLLPRIFPRREQYIRALRLEGLGLARALLAPTPDGLREAVAAALESRPEWTRVPDMDGHRRLCRVAAELLGIPWTAQAERARAQ